MQDAGDGAVGITGDDGSDLLCFHNRQGRGGEFVLVNPCCVRVQDFSCSSFQSEAAFAFEEAAEIAVTDDTEELAFGAEDRGHAETLFAHLVDDLEQRCLRRNLGQAFVGVHQFAYALKAVAEAASWMEKGEVFRAEVAALSGFDGQSVGKRQHGGSGCRRGEIHAAGFYVHADVEDEVCGTGKRGTGAAAEGDEGCCTELQGVEQAEKLFGFTGVGEGDQEIAFADHPDVAVCGLRCMKKLCRGAQRVKSGDELLRDMAAFAQADGDHATTSVGAGHDAVNGVVNRGFHGAAHAVGEAHEGVGFDADALGGGKRGVLHRTRCYQSKAAGKPIHLKKEYSVKRNVVVLAVIVLFVAGLFWAGVHNVRRRHAEEARVRQQQITLIPDGKAGSPVPDDDVPDLRGKQAAGFTLATLEGKKVSLADYKGRPVMVNFWATWCAPCKVEMPWFEEFSKNMRGRS